MIKDSSTYRKRVVEIDRGNHLPPPWANPDFGLTPEQLDRNSRREARWAMSCMTSLVVLGGVGTAAVWIVRNSELIRQIQNLFNP